MKDRSSVRGASYLLGLILLILVARPLTYSLRDPLFAAIETPLAAADAHAKGTNAQDSKRVVEEKWSIFSISSPGPLNTALVSG